MRQIYVDSKRLKIYVDWIVDIDGWIVFL